MCPYDICIGYPNAHTTYLIHLLYQREDTESALFHAATKTITIFPSQETPWDFNEISLWYFSKPLMPAIPERQKLSDFLTCEYVNVLRENNQDF